MSTSLGFPQPAIGSNNWGGPTNAGWALLNQLLTGVAVIPALNVSGNIAVGGSITAGAFIGLDGTFLTSALFNVANGIPRLNGAGLIPSSLLSNQGVVTVASSSGPVFDLSLGGVFDYVLAQNATAVFANGTMGTAIVAVRIKQAASGGPHTFTWPSNVRNAGTVNPGASSRSIQLLAVDSDGSLDAAAPMMYS